MHLSAVGLEYCAKIVSHSSFRVMWQTSAYSSCFPSLRMTFITATLLLRPLLMKLQENIDGSTEGSDAFLRSYVRSMLDL